MNLFEVYPKFDISLQKAKGVYVYDENETPYLDLYGGHGVISIGHSQPYYVNALQRQLEKIAFYSNSVQMPLQEELAQKLGELSGYTDYNLFLCNSGAEANENALKLASFHTQKRRVIAFKNSFHGRTAAALCVTDNCKIHSPLQYDNFPVVFLDLNDEKQFQNAFETYDDICAVIVEGVQGVGGLDYPSDDFLELLQTYCKKYNALLILDEIQSGFGRTGNFFAHQSNPNIRPDIITTAKGMGNGFPVAGVIIAPHIEAKHGMLGTTFGGNHLASVASLSVLEVLEKDNLMINAKEISDFLREELKSIPAIQKIKGKGLMLGVELEFPIKEIRKQLLEEFHIMTGSSANPNLLRILPPLSINKQEIKPFVEALQKILL
ncbi:aspartate aminotransferase family protein [Bernardetia sp.]|uniref:aspartate aminotransferase family protein n=1 Tax=Bernardetia sp. TaxID=1937974 RepID=UPI0025C5D566|nr:aminotransferase class III-fold pyridoxal phosphate-dependent enzyme [Bernardetia sp.]